MILVPASKYLSDDKFAQNLINVIVVTACPRDPFAAEHPINIAAQENCVVKSMFVSLFSTAHVQFEQVLKFRKALAACQRTLRAAATARTVPGAMVVTSSHSRPRSGAALILLALLSHYQAAREYRSNAAQ